MKIRNCRRKVVVFMFSVILVMGMGACSLDANGGTASEAETSIAETPTVPKPEISQPEAGKTLATQPPVPEKNGDEYSDTEEVSVGDPIIGIVDKYADNIIIIKDAGDPDLIYYFSTQNAQVAEGDSPIAVGDRVAIFYWGVMGDEGHPGEAVKVMPESMMYQ